MTYKQLAALIPSEYRKEILQLNMVQSAVGVPYNPTMQYLITIWTAYIEPDFTPDCNICCGRALDGFKAMLPAMIQMEKEDNLLNQV